MFDPRLDDEGPDAVHDHHRVAVLRSDCEDERVPSVPCSQVLAVALVAVDCDVVLTRVRVDEDHRDLALDGDIARYVGVKIIEVPVY